MKTVSCRKILILAKDPHLVKHQIETISSVQSPDPYPVCRKSGLLDGISTDHIIRIPDLLTENVDDLGRMAFCGMPEAYGFSPGILKKIRPDIIVAGSSFGMGSSREQAVTALLNCGVRAVIAVSFGPIFRKNALYNGLFTSTDLDLLKDMKDTGCLPAEAFFDKSNRLERDILLAGGLLPYLSGLKSLKDTSDGHGSHDMNVFEQRIARAVGRLCVSAGQTVFLPVTAAYSYVPLSDPARQVMLRHGIGKMALDPDHVCFFEDHFAYSRNGNLKKLTATQRRFACDMRIPESNYYKGLSDENGGKGISHRIMLERVNPEKIPVIIATDSHTPTLGALPLLAIPVGSTLLAAALSYGRIPFTVGNVCRITLKGELPFGTTIRDAQLEMAGRIKPPFGTSVIEFGGAGFSSLSMDAVAALCNMVPEIFIGDIAVTEPYAGCIKFLKETYGLPEETVHLLFGSPGKNARYAAAYEYDLSRATPWIALPGNPQNAVPLTSIMDHVPVTKAFLASCTNGLTEIAQAAAVMKGRKVAPGVRYLIVPSSETVRRHMHRNGYADILSAAGAYISDDSACSVCMGDGPFALRNGEIAVSATNRNFPGRLGHPGSKTYLAGPVITSLASVLGHLPTIGEYHQAVGQIRKSSFPDIMDADLPASE